MSPSLLFVDDDRAFSSLGAAALQREGYGVTLARSLHEARAALARLTPALVVLDRRLPDGDGLDLVRTLRADGRGVPIILLTALGSLDDRVGGLDAGADDYLVKPFERDELLARIRALLRRRPPRGEAALVCADLTLNPATHEVFRGDRHIELTQREFELLEYLMRNEKLVVPRQRLLEEVWGYDPLASTNTIEVFISNVRRKLEEGGEDRLVHTIRGAGYVLRVGR